MRFVPICSLRVVHLARLASSRPDLAASRHHPRTVPFRPIVPAWPSAHSDPTFVRPASIGQRVARRRTADPRSDVVPVRPDQTRPDRLRPSTSRPETASAEYTPAAHSYITLLHRTLKETGKQLQHRHVGA